MCLQQLSDKGDAMDSEEEFLEKQQEAEDRAAPVIVPPPVQLRCTLVVSNLGATAVLHLSGCGYPTSRLPGCRLPCTPEMAGSHQDATLLCLRNVALYKAFCMGSAPVLWRPSCCSCAADDKPFAFEAALQSHVGTHEVRLMEAMGLQGKLMLNCDASPDRPLLRISEDDSATYGGDLASCSCCDLASRPLAAQVCKCDCRQSQLHCTSEAGLHVIQGQLSLGFTMPLHTWGTCTEVDLTATPS
jgi:hypothetical protein